MCRAHNLRSLAATLCTEVVGHPHWRPTRAFANEPGRSCRSRPGVTTLRWKGTHGLLDFQFDLALPNDVVGLFKRLGGEPWNPAGTVGTPGSPSAQCDTQWVSSLGPLFSFFSLHVPRLLRRFSKKGTPGSRIVQRLRLQKIEPEVHECILKARIQSKWRRMRKEDAVGLCVQGKFQSSPTRPPNE